METIKIKCPNCDNRMEIDPKVIAFRCSQCGNRIDLDEQPIKNLSLSADLKQNVIKYVDQAEVLKVKNEYKLEKRRLRREFGRLYQRKNKPNVIYKEKYIGIGAGIIKAMKWFIIGILALLLFSVALYYLNIFISRSLW